jgi:hypothetical protein
MHRVFEPWFDRLALGSGHLVIASRQRRGAED